MAAPRTKGKCKYCGKEFTKAYMIQHLDACPKKKERLEHLQGKDCGWFEIEIASAHTNAYWLIIDIAEQDTLEDLDSFIRDIWVECCGHLSAFTIGRTEYMCREAGDNGGWFRPRKDMHQQLRSVLAEGMEFGYEYDFGDTTALRLNVLRHHTGPRDRGDIVILSRNEPIVFTCEVCGERPAAWINVTAEYEGGPVFYCRQCAAKAFGSYCLGDDDEDEYDADEDDDFDEDACILPVCNSPRMGVCDYTGSQIYGEEFTPDVPGD